MDASVSSGDARAGDSDKVAAPQQCANGGVHAPCCRTQTRHGGRAKPRGDAVGVGSLSYVPMRAPGGKTAADPKHWLVAGAIVGFAVAGSWAFRAARPAVPVAPEPDAVIAGRASASLPQAAAGFVARQPSSAAVAAAPAQDAGDDEIDGAFVATAKDAGAAAVPNRLGLSVDELVRAGLAQDVAEDVVESLNGLALTFERPPWTHLLRRRVEMQILLGVASQLSLTLADGGATVERADESHERVRGSAETGVVICCRDGILYPIAGRRGTLHIVVRERALPPELWQRYVAEHGSMDSMDSHASPASVR